MSKELKYSKYMPVTDHLGRHYDTVITCCLTWDIPEYSFRNRYLKGWDIEKILTKGRVKRNFTVSDHLGNKFDSAIDMCEYYGIDYGIFENRIHTLKMSLKDALTTPVRPFKNPYDSDEDDRHYESRSEMARQIGISRSGLYSRFDRGFTGDDLYGKKVKQGYKRESKRSVFYKGIHHNSYQALCFYYDFPYGTFMRRLGKGWPIEKILETPVRPHELPQPNTSEMVSEML